MESPFDRSEISASYDDWFRTPYGRLAERIEVELVLELLAPLEPGARLLDVGCGTGWYARRLRERGYRVTGLDPSARMLEQAAAAVPAVRADAQRLPFVDRAFDAAFLIAVLDFVPDPVAVLREARRVVRGRVAVTALASGSWLGLRRRIAARRGHPIFSQARFYSRHRLQTLARSSGAEPERVRGALFLPPVLASRCPALERSLCGRATLGAGIVAFSLPGLATD